MNTIREINIYLHNREMDGTASNPRMTWYKKQAVFVQLICSDDLFGWGECWTFDESAAALVEFLKTEIVPKVIGQPTDAINAIWNAIWGSTVLSGRHGITASALSGIDIALWDIAGKTSDKPISALIGEFNRSIPVYASSGLYKKNQSAKDLGYELASHVGCGHNIVKMKTGALSFERDLERLYAVRTAIGPETTLILDAVYGMNRELVSKWHPHWKEVAVAAIQAPFPADDWDSMVWLNQDIGIPVIAFEAESRIEIFRALMERGALGIMQFSCIAVGGITASLKLIELARVNSVPVTLQCSSTFFAEAVAMQLAACCKEIIHIELHQFHTTFYDMAPASSISPTNGYVKLPEGYGVGFTPPVDQLVKLARLR
ncbi:MAG: D-galactarolactone cycloisomerase [Desulforhopalus sp.]|jgi:D-galactarolactone cycloisomerase